MTPPKHQSPTVEGIWRLLTGNGNPEAGLVWQVKQTRRDLSVIKKLGWLVLGVLVVGLAGRAWDMIPNQAAAEAEPIELNGGG